MYRTAAGRAAADEATKPMALTITPRGKPIKNLPSETYALPSDTGKDLYERIAAKSRTSIHRLRITKGSDGSLVPNDAENTMISLSLYDQSRLAVKDLGPQIAWRTVFLIEYLGPLLIHPLVFFLRTFLYHHHGAELPPASSAQILSLTLICLHFLKRELETFFVHRFSAATMPVFNIFKNSAHYWLLAGLNIAVFTYSPASSCPTARPAPYGPWWNMLAVLLFVVGELGNLSVHLTFKGLRTNGGKERGIPRSTLFSMVPVTCPNYFFETVAWAGIWMSNRSLATGLFVVVAVGQMAVWARKKERRYRQEFGMAYQRKRFAMLPGIV